MSTIIGSLPYNLTNGTTADATQVMADFNSIVSQVNANGAAINQTNTFTNPQVMPNAVTSTQTVNAGQVQNGGLSWLGTIGGTANALTASPGVLPQAYGAGQSWEGNAVATNVAVAQTVAISIASPAVITLAGTQIAGTPVKFQSTGALPTGLVAATTYYIVNPVSGSFEVAAAPGGAPIATSGAQSGTQTVTMPTYAPVTLAIGSLAARNVTKYGGQVLAVGDLQAGMAFELLDDGVELQLINPNAVNNVSGGTTGSFLYQAANSLTGTMELAPGTTMLSEGAGNLPSQIYVEPAGTIIIWAGASIPPGYLQCPYTLTNISRTAYANLFNAIGTAWGAGDGSTTFAMPWFPQAYAPIQAYGISPVGTQGAGAVISHTHNFNAMADGGYGGTTHAGSSGNSTADALVTAATGSAANLAAGSYVIFLVKY